MYEKTDRCMTRWYIEDTWQLPLRPEKRSLRFFSSSVGSGKKAETNQSSFDSNVFEKKLQQIIKRKQSIGDRSKIWSVSVQPRATRPMFGGPPMRVSVILLIRPDELWIYAF